MKSAILYRYRYAHVCSKLSWVVVVRAGVFAPEEYLTDEVQRMGSTTEAAIDSVEAHLLRDCLNRGVVVARAVKYEVSHGCLIDPKVIQRLNNHAGHRLATMGAC